MDLISKRMIFIWYYRYWHFPPMLMENSKRNYWHFYSNLAPSPTWISSKILWEEWLLTIKLKIFVGLQFRSTKMSMQPQVMLKRFKNIVWIRFHHRQWKFKLLAGEFTWGNEAKLCWVMSTNFTPQANVPAHNLNFYWKWWDQIQASFLESFLLC